MSVTWGNLLAASWSTSVPSGSKWFCGCGSYYSDVLWLFAVSALQWQLVFCIVTHLQMEELSIKNKDGIRWNCFASSFVWKTWEMDDCLTTFHLLSYAKALPLTQTSLRAQWSHLHLYTIYQHLRRKRQEAAHPVQGITHCLGHVPCHLSTVFIPCCYTVLLTIR